MFKIIHSSRRSKRNAESARETATTAVYNRYIAWYHTRDHTLPRVLASFSVNISRCSKKRNATTQTIHTSVRRHRRLQLVIPCQYPWCSSEKKARGGQPRLSLGTGEHIGGFFFLTAPFLIKPSRRMEHHHKVKDLKFFLHVTRYTTDNARPTYDPERSTCTVVSVVPALLKGPGAPAANASLPTAATSPQAAGSYASSFNIQPELLAQTTCI